MKPFTTSSPTFVRLLCIAIFFLFGGVVEAQNILWKAKGASNTVYFMGSMHLLKEGDYPLPKAFEDVFEDAQKVVFETDLDGMESPQIQQLLMSHGMYSDGSQLKDHVSKETMALILENARRVGMSEEMLQIFKPWMAGLTLVVMDVMKQGFDPEHGIDRYFYKKAKAEKKETAGFEKPEFQVELLAGLSDTLSEEFLQHSLKESASLMESLQEMMDVWKGGDAEGLSKVLLASFDGYPEVREKFLLARNRHWAPQAQMFLREGKNVLVIVGAGHLVGKGSLIELLERSGVSVEQL